MERIETRRPHFLSRKMFVDRRMIAEFKTEMFGVVDLLSGDGSPWVHVIDWVTARMECVSPENASIAQFDIHPARYLGERQRIIDASHSFFDGAN